MVEALSDVTLCMSARNGFWDIFRNQPSIAFDVTWLGAHEESLVDDGLLSAGRRGCRCRRRTSPTRSACRTCTRTARCRRCARGLFALEDRARCILDAPGLARLARIGPQPPEPRPLL